MDLVCKVRLYQENGHYFAVLVAPDTMCSGTGRNIAEALANLGRSMADDPLSRSVEVSSNPKEPKRRRHVTEPTPDVREFPRYTPLVRRLLNERFGKATLRELADKLGLDDVTPQLLSSSIAGKGAKRVRLTIAKALGEDPNTLWPTARH